MNKEEIHQIARKRIEAKLHFYKHLSVYIAVIFLLFAINYRTSPDYYWFLWPLLGWGIAVVIHAIKVFGDQEGTRIKENMIESEIRKIQDTEKQ